MRVQIPACCFVSEPNEHSMLHKFDAFNVVFYRCIFFIPPYDPLIVIIFVSVGCDLREMK